MNKWTTPLNSDLSDVDASTLAEMVHRMREIDDDLRAAAEKLGQLYMFADVSQAPALTRRLDLPMRIASHNEREFAALLDELQMIARHRAEHAEVSRCGSSAAPQTPPQPAPRTRSRVRQATGLKT